MKALVFGIGAVLLGLGAAIAQPEDPAAAVAHTAGEEASTAARSRQVTRSAIGAVFGNQVPAPGTVPPSASAPSVGASAAPPDAQPAAQAAPAVENGAQDEDLGGEDSAADALAAAELRRDPFRPFTLNLRPETQEEEILSPLQRYELPQLRLAGVVLDLLPPRAMLQDNSGMGFIVTPGTPIGRRHGVVKSIEPRRIVVEEIVLDYYGRRQVHQVVLEMPKDDKPQGGSQEKS
ncbi:MAG: pilus assembly protein PilP [Candidatus Binatia bacterium]